MNVQLSPPRLRSVDLLRGFIMVLMVIDHVRVYSGQPPGGPEPGIFFTRWVTHFCAPVFAFLAGTAAFFHGRKAGIPALTRFLFRRGLFLVFLEITVVRLGWTFNLRLDQFMLAGIIWMLGWSMVIMALLVRLKPLFAGLAGLAIILFQDLFRLVPLLFPPAFRGTFAQWWAFFYPSDFGGPEWIWVLFSVIPWLGVMAAGYGFGLVMQLEPRRRARICRISGLLLFALFVAIGSCLIVFGKTGNTELPFVMRLLDQRKYPASQLYLAMTLGPLLFAIPWAERLKGRLPDALVLIGSVPLFYYLLHIPLNHLSSLVMNLFRYGITGEQWYVTAPFSQVPPEYKWPLWGIYVTWFIDLLVLYLACRWYAAYKKKHPGKRWLRYL